MKTIKLTGLLLVSLLIMNGCASDTINEPKTGFVPYHSYTWLHLRFQDASGNDLLKGLAIGYFYTLDVIFPDERMSPYLSPPRSDPFAGFRHQPLFCAITGERREWCPPPAQLRPTLFLAPPHNIFDYYYRLLFRTFSHAYYVDNDVVAPLPRADRITIKLTSPHIFDDDVAREIVVYWELFDEVLTIYCYVKKLDRIEFEGKEMAFEPIPHSIKGHTVGYIVTIVVDK